MKTTSRSYPIDSSLTMAEAGSQWLDQHKRNLKPSTIRVYKNALKSLNPLFGQVAVCKIDVGHIQKYQEERSAKAGPQHINYELFVLQQILKRAGHWKKLREFYKPMRVSKRLAGHSLSEEQEGVLRQVAFSKPKWRLTAHCMAVMLSTTMGFGELRMLRRRDVDMQRPSVTVGEGAKNTYRARTIPLNQSAYDSMSWILDRWKILGGTESNQYILPHRPRSKKGRWIFDEPMWSINTACERIRKEAGLARFRVYDCRVQAITKLLSNPAVSPQVSKEIAGHISQAMQDRYSIQTFETKKAALNALEAAPRERQSPDTAFVQPSIHDFITHPAIQSEIARQVALQLREHRIGGIRPMAC